MIVREQKPLVFNNACNAIFKDWQLEQAMLWYSQILPVCRVKKIFLYGKYPAVSMRGEKIHIHRLLVSWLHKRRLKKQEYVHHKDGDKLNGKLSNLELMSVTEHQSITNKGRKFTNAHRERIGQANKNRVGMKYKK